MPAATTSSKPTTEPVARALSGDEMADEMMEQLAPDSARALEGFIDAYLAAGFTREEAAILAETHHRQVMAGVRRKAVAFTRGRLARRPLPNVCRSRRP